jgi:hypothetical protein
MDVLRSHLHSSPGSFVCNYAPSMLILAFPLDLFDIYGFLPFPSVSFSFSFPSLVIAFPNARLKRTRYHFR